MPDRFIGIDIGAETIKVVELVRDGQRLRWVGREIAEHHKNPGPLVLALLRRLDWNTVRAAAVSGRAAPETRH